MSIPDFTGERFIPGQGGAQIAYEHLHRYQFALRWAGGKKVLDVAAGIGYGAALLAGTAQSVWAIDLDAASVAYARRTYPKDNLLFLQGDATFLPVKSRMVDFALALEVLEHVEKQEELVAELARVVRAAGTVLISTPNKAVYSDARGYCNPFHLREFYRDEFLDLLGRHFKSIELVHQQVRAGSLMLSEDARPDTVEIVAEPMGDVPAPAPMYLIALCRVSKPLRNIPRASAFLDTGDGLLGEWEQRLKTAGSELDRINQELEKLGTWCHEIETGMEARDASIRELQMEMEREVHSRDQRVSGLQEEVEKLSRWGLELQDSVANRDRLISSLQEEMSREIVLRDGMLAGIQDELNERARWMQDLEKEIAERDRTIQSLQHDHERELAHRDEALAQLQNEIAERNQWAQNLEQEIGERDRSIQALQQDQARELADRDQALEQLQHEITERNRWAADLESDIASRDEKIRRTQEALDRLDAQFAERGKWAQDLQAEVAGRDRTIQALQAEFTERGRWAQDLEREIAARDVRLRDAVEELGRISTHLDQLRRRRIYRILSRLGIFPASV